MAEEVRFVGLDVHKAQVTVAMVNREQQLSLKPCKIATNQFQAWVDKHLKTTDQVVLEA